MEKRQSNFELLRILSIFMIAIFHCALYSGFTFTQGLDANGLLIKTFWMFGEAGVNLFILISGYFLITSRFRWKKLVLLAAEVWFYCWTTASAAFLLTGKAFAGKRDLFMNLFPVVGQRYWFATAYVVLYLLSPFLNIFLRAMDQKTYRRFLGLVLLLYSVIPTFTGLATNSTEDFLFFNRLIWMMILYSVAAYIRLYPEPWMSNAKWGGVLSAASFMILVLSIVVIDRFSTFFARLGTEEPAYLWRPNTIPMFTFSAGMFLLFSCLKTRTHIWINRLASTTFAVYLLHEGNLSKWLWGTLFHCRDYQGSPWLGVRILLSALAVVVLGMIIDLFRQLLEKHTLRPLLNRLWPDAPKRQMSSR